MKHIYTAIAALLVVATGFAQTDSTKKMSDTSGRQTDTIRVGNFIIIKKNKTNSSTTTTTELSIERKPQQSTKFSTNWFIFDLGFANTNDQTDYTKISGNSYLKAQFTKDDFKLRASKSSNVNIWVVMQKLNLAKGYVNLKYGIGLEMFNLRYQTAINYERGASPYIFMDSLKFSKNKLYAGYASVPIMLNFNTTPGKHQGFSFSAGISAGYLIGSHDKQISGERGKDKTHGDLGLEQFRLAYVGELGIGPVRLFGSYSITKLHESGLEQYPYSLGIRFSNW